MALNLQHQTSAQFAARFRERYRTTAKGELARIATLILNWIEAGDFTDTQVRNAFELNTTQWTTLKAKMTNLRTYYLAIQAATGE